jgi:hypothetical protein
VHTSLQLQLQPFCQCEAAVVMVDYMCAALQGKLTAVQDAIKAELQALQQVRRTQVPAAHA